MLRTVNYLTTIINKPQVSQWNNEGKKVSVLWIVYTVIYVCMLFCFRTMVTRWISCSTCYMKFETITMRCWCSIGCRCSGKCWMRRASYPYRWVAYKRVLLVNLTYVCLCVVVGAQRRKPTRCYWMHTASMTDSQQYRETSSVFLWEQYGMHK